MCSRIGQYVIVAFPKNRAAKTRQFINFKQSKDHYEKGKIYRESDH